MAREIGAIIGVCVASILPLRSTTASVRDSQSIRTYRNRYPSRGRDWSRVVIQNASVFPSCVGASDIASHCVSYWRWMDDSENLHWRGLVCSTPDFD